MFLKPTEPSKDSLHSQMTFVLQENLQLQSLPEIMTDLLKGSDAFSKERRNVSFVTHDGARASIVVSKDCTKLKLQADSLDKHWLVISQLFSRLESHFGDKNIENVLATKTAFPQAKDLITWDSVLT